MNEVLARRQYRFALNARGLFVDVVTLGQAARKADAPFWCLGCQQELIPKMGPVRIWHFAHWPGASCNPESYLHKAAKRAFYDGYIEACTQGLPVTFERKARVVCNRFKASYGLTCVHPRERVDLTEYFDLVEMERSWGTFRPDVLLASSRHEEVLFIEFTVTHRCSVVKRESGPPIVEIDVPNESIIPALRQCRFPDPRHIRLYNVRNSVERDVCHGQCRREACVFVLDGNGTSRLLSGPLGDVAAERIGGANVVFRQVIGWADEIDDRDLAYRHGARCAHFDGQPIRNCWVCIHHDRRNDAAYCRLLGRRCASSAAASCQKYRPVASEAELREILERNQLRHRGVFLAPEDPV